VTLSSIAELRALASGRECSSIHIDLLFADDYDDWCVLVNRCLGLVSDMMSENPELRKDRSEDEITIEIVNIFRHYPFDVSHEAKVGGHADIVVRGKRNWLWIAEAKRHDKGYAWIYQGFQQLTTRYTTGNVGQNAGALLIYTAQENTSRMMQRWKEHLLVQDKAISTDPCPEPFVTFVSSHPHARTGLAFKVTHLSLSLLFDPKDKH
jgi:hypothetical protein